MLGYYHFLDEVAELMLE